MDKIASVTEQLRISGTCPLSVGVIVSIAIITISLSEQPLELSVTNN